MVLNYIVTYYFIVYYYHALVIFTINMIKKFRLLLLALLSPFIASSQYNALFWQITGNGLTQPSYLYGTMHTNDARVFNYPAKVEEAIGECNAFAMELDPKEVTDMGLLNKMMMDKGQTLSKLLPEEDFRQLDSLLLAKMGLSLNMFDKMSPIIVTAMLEEIALGEGDTTNTDDKMDKEFLDLYLHGKAKAKGKKIIGIETTAEQLNALNVLSYKEQAEMLSAELHFYLSADSTESKDLMEFYVKGELDSLAKDSKEYKMPPKLVKALITDRNRRMANRIAEFIQKQPTFSAVGALHLAGEEGVVALLRKKGFTVEPVK
jgi:uncharacterized protein YbaP (TraB family)